MKKLLLLFIAILAMAISQENLYSQNHVPKSSHVKLIVYDVLGREIANLIPPLLGGQVGLLPGTYEVEWDGTNYSSGVYYYKLINGDYTEIKKMILVK
jgi:hypothetical protein